MNIEILWLGGSKFRAACQLANAEGDSPAEALAALAAKLAAHKPERHERSRTRSKTGGIDGS